MQEWTRVKIFQYNYWDGHDEELVPDSAEIESQINKFLSSKAQKLISITPTVINRERNENGGGNLTTLVYTIVYIPMC